MPRTRGAVKLSAGGPVPAPAPVPEPSATSSMATKRPPARRAASAAPALPPTPPRTTHKRKRRSRSRVTDSSSEEEDEHEVPVVDSDGEDERGHSRKVAGALILGHKKRRVPTLDAIAEELSEATAEDAFWLGDGMAASSSGKGGVASGASQPRPKVVKNRAPTRARSRTRSPSSSPPPAPHLLRRGHTGLFSPPPSRRAPVVVPRPATPPPEPKPSKEQEKGLPVRDSPNNPFLFGDSPSSVPASEGPSSPEPHTPKKREEKPTIAYVFRGVKTLLANPHYHSPGAAAEIAEAEARARLPVHHPDFSPIEACEPKLLFPEARRTQPARRRARAVVPAPTSPTPRAGKRRAGSSSSDEGQSGPAKGKGKAVAAEPGPSTIPEVEDADAMSAALAARVSKRMRKGIYADGDAPRTRPSSQAGDVPHLPEKDRTDPMKRAMGPVRPA